MDDRNRLNTLNIPGLFQDAETMLSVFIKIFDVSDGGLGVFSADHLTPGQELIWITLHGEIRLRVKWCNDQGGEEGFIFRAGLECTDACHDLYAIMQTTFDTLGARKGS